MTEKRFTKQEVYDGINRYRINDSNFIVEILDDGIPMHYSTIVNRLNEQHKTITRLEKENEQLKSENDSYKNMFFEIVETALTDTNCKELYCKGILDIFDKANSLNQAREIIKEHLK